MTTRTLATPAFVFGILVALAVPIHAQTTPRQLVIHVDSPDAEVMTEALHNAANVIETERKAGENVAIEIVANGPGSSIFISELTPVADAVRSLHTTYPGIVMSLCQISFAHTEAATKKTLTVMPEARLVPSGAVRIMDLEQRHWAYLKP